MDWLETIRTLAVLIVGVVMWKEFFKINDNLEKIARNITQQAAIQNGKEIK